MGSFLCWEYSSTLERKGDARETVLGTLQEKTPLGTVRGVERWTLEHGHQLLIVGKFSIFKLLNVVAI